ncbi:MAG: hypothetical protein ABI939_04755 [Anaerolineaceae bacterium]
MTVTPDLQRAVSGKLREEFENGRAYYAMNGQRLIVVPNAFDEQPSQAALLWHAENVFKKSVTLVS